MMVSSTTLADANLHWPVSSVTRSSEANVGLAASIYACPLRLIRTLRTLRTRYMHAHACAYVNSSIVVCAMTRTFTMRSHKPRTACFAPTMFNIYKGRCGLPPSFLQLLSIISDYTRLGWGYTKSSSSSPWTAILTCSAALRQSKRDFIDLHALAQLVSHRRHSLPEELNVSEHISGELGAPGDVLLKLHEPRPQGLQRRLPAEACQLK